jgi:hypothetical protein
MPLFFKYFWFIGAAFMFVNLVIWRQRFAPIVATPDLFADHA